MSSAHLVHGFEQQAEACLRLGSPLYGELLGHIARDIAEGGPCAAAVEGYEHSGQDDALPLRLLGGAHALALTGAAPRLAAHYPTAGGSFDPTYPDAAWPEFRALMAAERERVRHWLPQPPQTNEVGRSHLLVAGLLHTVPSAQLPVRLFELGTSAGLNLRADHFRTTAEDFSWGPERSPVQLTQAWRSGVPDWLREAANRQPALRIVERRGCDPAPLDPLSATGSLALRAYVWPDQTYRMARLEGAMAVAAKVPGTVEACGAADFLAGIELEAGTLTVVWHSVMRQYVPDDEWARVERELDRLAGAATSDALFAVLSFEPNTVSGKTRFQLIARPGRGPGYVLADARPHGLPAWQPMPLG